MKNIIIGIATTAFGAFVGIAVTMGMFYNATNDIMREELDRIQSIASNKES